MARLTEEMVMVRSKQSELSSVKKLNCWGAELGDVSLIRQMPNVEVLALSINKIRTLDVFTNCRRLRELYIRKNEIRSLSEIRHLRHLPHLTSLWLDENPCTEHPEYRMTVLRNLPRLEKLDNQPVSPDELAEAERRGHHIPDSDDEGYPQQESYTQYRSARSIESSPEREQEYIPTHTQSRHEGSDCSEPGVEPAPEPKTDIQPTQSHGDSRRPSGASPDSDERFEHPAMTRSVYEPRSARSPDGSLRHSFSAQNVKVTSHSMDRHRSGRRESMDGGGSGPLLVASFGGGLCSAVDVCGLMMMRMTVQDYAYSSNGDCRYSGEGRGGGGVTSPPYNDPYYEKPERSESYQQVPQRCPAEWEQDRASVRERDREYPSAVMAEHRGFTRRPVARNSNLLSAVLCLVKELDYPSLEVAEMAVRCRMDELANSQ